MSLRDCGSDEGSEAVWLVERVGALVLGLGSVMAEIGVEAGRRFERLEVEETIIIFDFLSVFTLS